MSNGRARYGEGSSRSERRETALQVSPGQERDYEAHVGGGGGHQGTAIRRGQRKGLFTPIRAHLQNPLSRVLAVVFM